MNKGILYTILTALLFVTLEPVSKLIAQDVHPFVITFYRFAIGSLLLLPFAIHKIRHNKVHISLKDLGIMTLLGILFICISMIILQVGVKMAASASTVAIIFSSNSVFTILFAIPVLKEKVTLPKCIALILGVAGVLIGGDIFSGVRLASVLCAVFSALTFSLYVVLCRKLTKNIDVSIQSCVVFMMGSLVLLIMLLVMRIDVLPTFTPSVLTTLGYLGVLVTGVGYLCYFKSMEKGGTIMASLAFFIKPVLTPFVTWVINGVVPDFRVFLSVAFIVAASYFAAFFKKKNAPAIKKV